MRVSRCLRSTADGSLLSSATAGNGYRIAHLRNRKDPKLANRQVMELLHKMMKEDCVDLSIRGRSLLDASFRQADEQKLLAELTDLRTADFPWKDLLRDVQALREYVRARGFTSETIVCLLAFDWSRPEIRKAVFAEVSESNRKILNEEIRRMEVMMSRGEKSYRTANPLPFCVVAESQSLFRSADALCCTFHEALNPLSGFLVCGSGCAKIRLQRYGCASPDDANQRRPEYCYST